MRKDRIIGLLAAVAASGLAGCGEAEDTGFLAITQVSRYTLEAGGCGPPDKKLLPSLFYDAGLGAEQGTEYSLGLWLANTLEPNGDDDTAGKSTGRINTNRIQVNRIVVEFTDRNRWGFLPESIEVGMPFMVDSLAEIGWPTRLIPEQYAKVMIEHPDSPLAPGAPAELMPITIRAKGKLMDGTEVESNPFDLVLQVCDHCLPGGCGFGWEYDKGCSFAQPDLYECKEAEEEQ